MFFFSFQKQSTHPPPLPSFCATTGLRKRGQMGGIYVGRNQIKVKPKLKPSKKAPCVSLSHLVDSFPHFFFPPFSANPQTNLTLFAMSSKTPQFPPPEKERRKRKRKPRFPTRAYPFSPTAPYSSALSTHLPIYLPIYPPTLVVLHHQPTPPPPHLSFLFFSPKRRSAAYTDQGRTTPLSQYTSPRFFCYFIFSFREDTLLGFSLEGR